ncbi:class I SAM-dependent DNA methyltransferase [Kitasatospora sp. NPDC058046]|uniref:class I SAM-dependent DNA methyltransferase n=1 Tax=Kitasatospora sp. NPDC058046 TaxID=3346312 RepID=UPI0036D8D668
MNPDRAALRDAYDRAAAHYGDRRNPRFDRFRAEALDHFAEQVRATGGTRVLDLGAGPGHECEELRNRGLDPLAVDFSPAMVARCRARGIEACEQDLYDLRPPGAPRSGALASFSLLHVPKADLGAVVERIADSLVPGAVLLVLLFEGEGEGPREADRAAFGVARHFSYYRPDELAGALGDRFEIVDTRRLDISPRPTLTVTGRLHAAGPAPREDHHA